MALGTEEFSLLDLSRDDLSKLPSDLRKKIAAAFGPEEELSGDWLLVGARHAGFVPVLTNAMRTLLRLVSARHEHITERTIERVIDILLDDAPGAEFDADIATDNVLLRAEFLRETPMLSGTEVRAGSSLSPKNRSEPASRWKREDKIFAVPRGGVNLYPAFQFADGAPIPALKAILAALPSDLTPWQIAFWFASGNGWLDGAAPHERLNTPDDVIEAARQLANPAIG